MSHINIVIPMAGAGSRFAKEGYSKPKPLIEVHGIPMIQLVIENLKPKVSHRFIFICQKAHNLEYHIAARLQEFAPGSICVETEGLTEGAACTVLLAQEHINNGDSLMIANSDQYVETDIDTYLSKMKTNGLDGLIMTMPASDPKWSFVRLDAQNNVTEVVEKKVISHEATVGIYNFASGRQFVEGAKKMIAKNLRVNNEFYVAPVYNELIHEGAKIGIHNIGDHMHGIGTPEDLTSFLSKPVSHRATGVKNDHP